MHYNDCGYGEFNDENYDDSEKFNREEYEHKGINEGMRKYKGINKRMCGHQRFNKRIHERKGFNRGGQNSKLYKHKDHMQNKCVKICSTNLSDTINPSRNGNRWKKLAAIGMVPILYDWGKYTGTKYVGEFYIVMELLKGEQYELSEHPNKKQLALQLIENSINNKIVIDSPIKQEIFITDDGLAKWTDIDIYDGDQTFDACETDLKILYDEIQRE